jgi:hypothetical protein
MGGQPYARQNVRECNLYGYCGQQGQIDYTLLNLESGIGKAAHCFIANS